MLHKPYAIAAFALLARAADQTEEMPLTFLGWLEAFVPFGVGATSVLFMLGWRGIARLVLSRRR
ncbi:hypothetical protein [Corynebacterium timonense]|uniref:hypothetical protein n=1 Tax=Corynebacterium timonense TaxID=441500 RepID=UPI0002E0B7C8|nr:hypothetical protein [Corynebacterium timonense]